MPKPSRGKAATAATAAAAAESIRTQHTPLAFNTSKLEDGTTIVEVSVVPTPEGLGANGRRPADIVCVVDISGSMDCTYHPNPPCMPNYHSTPARE